MTNVIVRINSQQGIELETEGLGKGKLTAERTPRIRRAMGFGGGEILCFAVGACFYNNLRSEAHHRNIELDNIEVEVSAEWEDDSLVAHGFGIRPHVESKATDEEIQALFKAALEVSSVANTVLHGAPVRII
jgi:uncharacterized OsmC-like protein